MQPEREPVYTTRRRIVSEHFEDGVLMRYGRHEEPVPGDGDVHHTATVVDAVAETNELRAALDAAIEAVRPRLTWPQYDAITSGVNNLESAIRLEAIARLIAAAQETLDHEVSLYVAPDRDADERSVIASRKETPPMDPRRCPRCGVSEFAQLRIRTRLVMASIALAAVGGFMLGRTRR